MFRLRCQEMLIKLRCQESVRSEGGVIITHYFQSRHSLWGRRHSGPETGLRNEENWDKVGVNRTWLETGNCQNKQWSVPFGVWEVCEELISQSEARDGRVWPMRGRGLTLVTQALPSQIVSSVWDQTWAFPGNKAGDWVWDRSQVHNLPS